MPANAVRVMTACWSICSRTVAQTPAAAGVAAALGSVLLDDVESLLAVVEGEVDGGLAEEVEVDDGLGPHCGAGAG